MRLSRHAARGTSHPESHTGHRTAPASTLPLLTHLPACRYLLDVSAAYGLLHTGGSWLQGGWNGAFRQELRPRRTREKGGGVHVKQGRGRAD